MALDEVPARFLTPEREREFLKWLRLLPIQPEDKKQLLLYWHRFLGLPLSGDDVDEVLGISRRSL